MLCCTRLFGACLTSGWPATRAPITAFGSLGTCQKIGLPIISSAFFRLIPSSTVSDPAVDDHPDLVGEVLLAAQAVNAAGPRSAGWPAPAGRPAGSGRPSAGPSGRSGAALAQVEDQVRVADLEQVEDALDVVLVDHADFRDLAAGARRIDRPAASCLASARRRKFMSSRSMFRARSAMRVLEPVHFQGDVGVAQGQVEVDEGDGVVRVGGQGAPRLTARVVHADAAARAEDGDDRAMRPSGGAIGCRGPSRSLLPCSPRARRRAASMSSRPTGCVRKYFAPFWSDWSSAWWSWLMVRIGSFGCSTESWPIICRAFCLSASRATIARSGQRRAG